MDIPSQIERVRAKIEDLQLCLRPPLALEEVLEFESIYRVRLPEGYRQFLLKVGNGGDGPTASGIFGLGLGSQTALDNYGMRLIEPFLAHLDLTFPFQEEHVYDDSEPSLSRKEVLYGNLLIGDDGCVAFTNLIVNGPQRGYLWRFWDGGIYPLRKTFLNWYEEWLDNLSHNPHSLEYVKTSRDF